ncbi:hypothetical protein LUD75_13170 [Epilithonimonas sp. JDS]|uniref:hypothetical protein n=1 Tax=Epilithonimonas sp. JDS TaxID=2902797 RepID=UPI001E588842|nr:hypothetical protein [Epilithonimonas sp. JDS]MCD9855667.1 hypothetical protein [Epilithonimonas sp. JDS]
MKTLFALLFSLHIYSQNCNCESKPELKEIISCKKEKFSNGTTLSWQFDCNSYRLIFQNGKSKKTIFELESDLMDFTGRLGYSNWKEYDSTFLIENRPVSGCCDPSEYILFDKNSGSIIKKLGTSLYQTSEKDKSQFIVTLKDLNTILITNLVTNKISTIKLPPGRLESSLEKSQSLFAENLFDQPIITDNLIEIRYKYTNPGTKNWKISTVTIDLSKDL